MVSTDALIFLLLLCLYGKRARQTEEGIALKGKEGRGRAWTCFFSPLLSRVKPFKERVWKPVQTPREFWLSLDYTLVHLELKGRL